MVGFPKVDGWLPLDASSDSNVQSAGFIWNDGCRADPAQQSSALKLPDTSVTPAKAFIKSRCDMLGLA